MPTVLRVPEEFDLSLGERLALGLQALDELDEPTGYARVPPPQGASVNQLTVDRKRVKVTRGPLGKRLPVLTTDRIEAIRVGGTSASPLLSLVSERRVLRIPMSQPLARWAKRNIERHLRAVYDKPPKLAR